MANFFNEIIAPQLNSTEYGKGIQEMVDNINNNFQKVFTLPFLQGDDGDMISTEFCPFWKIVYNSNNEIDVDNCLLTQEGVKIFNTIFETDKFYYSDEEYRMTYKNFKDVLIDDLNLYSYGNSYNNISLFNELYGPYKDPKILLFYKISSEDGVSETPLGSAQLYYYFDPRISKLSELITINNNENTNSNPDINYRQNFEDYTCILSTKYDSNGNYTYEKQSGWPTLYFDNNSKQYCWQINGQQTGVNAQGVNGKDGIGARIWVCQVKLDTKNSSQVDYENGIMSQFIITKVFVPRDSQWYTKILDNDGEWTGKWQNEDDEEVDLKNYLGETNYFQQGDMAVCYLSNTENNYSDQIIGVINQNSSDKTFFVQSSISQNNTNTFKNLSLFNLLSSIGTGEKDTPTMKGIFIPTTVGDNTSAHTLYEGRFNGQDLGLYLVKTDNYNNIKYDDKQISLKNNGDTFNIYYNTNVHGDFNIRDLLNFKYTYNAGDTFPILNIIPSVYDNTDPQVNLGTVNNKFGNIYVSNIYAPIIYSENIISTSIKIDKISSNSNITLSTKNIYPNQSNTISLGDNDKRFNNIYTKNFNASESLTIKKVDYNNNGEVSKHYGQTFIKGGNFYINSTGDIKEEPDSNYVGLSYKDNDLIFCGNYDDKWGGNSSIPIIKSTRYDDSGTSSIENMIRFRNNGTQIYDKLFVGNDNNSIIKNTLPTDYTLYVNGQTYINAELTVSGATTLNDTLTVGTTTSNKDTTLNGKLVVADTTQLNNAVTLNWNKSNYYDDDTTTSDLLAKSLLNIGGEGYLRVIFSRNSIQGLSNTKDGEHYKTNTLNINPLGGGVNIGGTTTLNSDLILNSIKHNDTPTYSSNKIVFCRGNQTDGYNDWLMYGNTNGQLEIDCSRSGLSDGKIMTLSCDNSGNKSVNVVGKITGKVDNIEEVNIGMPVGSIIQWLNPHNMPDGYILFNTMYGYTKNNSINKLFNKYDGGNIKNKMTSTYVGKTDMGVTFNNEISINIVNTNATIKYNTRDIVNFDLNKIPIICSLYTYTFTNDNKMLETCLSQKGYYLTENSTLYDTTNNYDNEKQKFLFIELISKLLGNQNDNKTQFVLHLMVNDSNINNVSIYSEKLYILYDFDTNNNVNQDGNVYLNCKNKLLYDNNNDNDNNLLEIFTDKNNNPIGINFNRLYIGQTNSDTYDILKYK